MKGENNMNTTAKLTLIFGLIVAFLAVFTVALPFLTFANLFIPMLKTFAVITIGCCILTFAAVIIMIIGFLKKI